MQTPHWHRNWALGLAVVPGVYFATRGLYFSTGSIYASTSPWKGHLSYFLSLLAVYVAVYVLTSLVLERISKREASSHLVLWTVLPPIWFAFERYFFFECSCQTPESLKLAHEALREGQDYSSKLWSAVLAVLLAFKLGELVKEKAEVPRAV